MKGNIMKRIFSTILIGLTVLAFSPGTFAAGEKGTAEEALALTKKAIAYIKANGREKSFAEFNNPAGQFRDRDLYIFVIDMNGKMLAHGSIARLINKDVLDMKDADGKPLIKEFIDVAKAKGSGWVDYKWPNPTSKAVEPKSSYVEKLEDMVVGCGIYK
jgi:cytochrome c